MREWIIGVVGAAMISAITLTVTPESRVKRVVSITCGFMMIIMLLSPLRSFDYDAFRRGLGALRADGEQFAYSAAAGNANIEQAVIRQRVAEYIADKGTRLGLAVYAVSVELADEGAYPVSAVVVTDADEALRRKLALDIEANLGIAAQDIRWGDADES